MIIILLGKVLILVPPNSRSGITVTGYDNGVAKYSTTDIYLPHKGYSYFTAGWEDIDTLIITEIINVDCAFVMDNFTFNPNSSSVPIPGTLWLFGSGLMGIIGICKYN